MERKIDPREVIAARLERVRAYYEIPTRSQFAKQAGMTDQQYSDVMNLRRDVSRAQAIELCKVYSLTWEFIYFGNKGHLEHRMAMAL